jgi:hypothetical protein
VRFLEDEFGEEGSIKKVSLMKKLLNNQVFVPIIVPE